MKNKIIKSPISSIGYYFIPTDLLPESKDEYYLRNIQNRSGIDYRQLNAREIEVLVHNRNTSDNWNNILVSAQFNPELVRNCHFYGLVRIGMLENISLTFHDIKTPVGLYNSTIISSDFGDNVSVQNVSYLSHYIVGNEVIMNNINECVTTPFSKFGNGIVKDGEAEDARIWLEICNENGGRKVMPFVGMLPGDAWLWSKYRDDSALLEQFKSFTEKEFKTSPGYYGKIGDRTIIKNCGIIKDTWIGTDAYIKGASKIKNVTVQSGEEGRTQIGEGSEIVNGVIGFGCRLFYGIKAVRFVMASHSQLKYGARLINSYLGNNATISCCEVLNSLIFPAHEQHHNNSFLCAALIMGQSNIPAGATLGSNHNSRAADGEFAAGRGFWPALCVNIKHNSRFASFSILARGNYPYELDVQIPFSLLSNNENNGNLEIMVGYWFLYNMYALSRNAQKYQDRDKRVERIQFIETDYLAPDTIQELLNAKLLIEKAVGEAYLCQQNKSIDDPQKTGRKLLAENNPVIDELEVTLSEVENSKRKVVLTKVRQGYHAFMQMFKKFGVEQLLLAVENDFFNSYSSLPLYTEWLNVGGQLFPKNHIDQLREDIKSHKIDSWDRLHEFYTDENKEYAQLKSRFGLYILQEILEYKELNHFEIKQLFDDAIEIEENISKEIYQSRSKDYQSHFRKMMYDSAEEMEEVIGALDDNSFISDQKKALENYKKRMNHALKLISHSSINK